MAERKRTAKSLGQRHDLHYFQKWGPWRVTRAVLMAAVPAVAALWLLSYALQRNSVPYSSGPLSSVHSFTGTRCDTCHAPALQAGFVAVGFRKHVSDAACLSCHQAPAHQASLETFTPACASCHVEHVGSTHLRQTADQSCVQCHGDLKVKNGQPHYQTAIYNFDSRHPEFAVLRDGYNDPGTIKLNHAVHMRAGLLGPNSRPVQLQCQDCHRTPAEQGRPWKYGEAQMVQASLTAHDPHNPAMPAGPTRPDVGRSYMAAPTYATGCQNCHALQFDAHFAESVPHDDPRIVREFVVNRLRQYIQQHPQALHEEIRPARLIFGGKISREGQQPVIARTPAEWVDLRAKDAETLLWHKTCIQCHALIYTDSAQSGPAGLPTVAPSNIKPQWLANSVFSHYAHESFDCKSCHTRAAASQETSDVLIPSIKTCQSCHNGEPTKVGQAQNGCFLCHQYHNWKGRDEPFIPTHSIPQSRNTAAIHENPDVHTN
jgi:hypothetical protein